MDIQLKQVSIQIDGKPILNNVNLSLLKESINCLMGPSGKGKTTILNLIMGLIKLDTGELLGNSGLQIAAVFQEDRLIEHWDALKNISLVCDKLIEKEYILQELQQLGIEESTGKPVRDFSGGMRRRVAIIRALLAKSDLVIMDEPFRGLDIDLKEKVIKYIKEKTKGKTVIVVTHEIEDVMQLEGNLIALQ